MYYRSRKDPLTALRQRMRELAQTRVRFGCRRRQVLLLAGWVVGKERSYRVYTHVDAAARLRAAVNVSVDGHQKMAGLEVSLNDRFGVSTEGGLLE